MRLGMQESKQEVIKVVSLVQNDRKSTLYIQYPYIVEDNILKYFIQMISFDISFKISLWKISYFLWRKQREKCVSFISADFA